MEFISSVVMEFLRGDGALEEFVDSIVPALESYRYRCKRIKYQRAALTHRVLASVATDLGFFDSAVAEWGGGMMRQDSHRVLREVW